MRLRPLLAAAAFALAATPAAAVDLGIVAFQMSSDTHARVANAAKAAAEELGWDVTLLNSAGAMPEHAAQIENLIQADVDAIIIAMGKPVETDAQLAEAKAAGIPVITVASGGSQQTLFDVQANEYQVGAMMALYMLGELGYEGKILEERFEGNVATRIRGRILDAVLAENTAVEVAGTHAMARTKSWRDDVRAGMEALILQNQGEIDGIWASFDGQAFIIDDILAQQGMAKGDVVLVSADGGPEAYDRIADASSLLMATVTVPFEEMGEIAVDSVKRILDGESATDITPGPYYLVDPVLVDQSNVAEYVSE
ncbi:sugar ABC transporter substrate-binding protein [Acuticoccus sp. I52.16.1]|uniref:sugar ABC transporter substrate-binding protein n=1 Tax=Acuticoccus sp. I52.16.1 TaxID=2928472 RepID=UPI001FD53DCD|nr:sugar ABC transporter substrate-binding protein [Acuticoccus sp. I52.16.1]UOM35629.1 sugar ABC transporter substrate-binding protein [Acuticoccus sp. I52.16.1]